MSMQRLWIGLAILVTVALSAWLYLQLTSSPSRENHPLNGINYRAEGITLTQYNREGNRRYRLIAAKLVHTIPDDITHLYTLTLTLLPTTGSPVILKTPRAEMLADGKHVLMPDRVLITRQTPRGKIRLLTSAVTVDIPKQTASSAMATQILGPGYDIHGLGMQADFANHVFTLLHAVNSTYQP